jgi:transcriptional regulator with XRE-family HTH domain
MALKNDDIVKRIKLARAEAKLTQKDVAEHLGRTSAAISDLERGNVQVSAVDLFKLAKLFKRPIEYFYGDNFGGIETQEIVNMLRSITPEERVEMLPPLRSLLRMYEIQKQLQALMDKLEPDRNEAEKLVIEFYGIIQLFAKQSEAVTAQSKGMETQLAELLNLGGQQEQPKE